MCALVDISLLGSLGSVLKSDLGCCRLKCRSFFPYWFCLLHLCISNYFSPGVAHGTWWLESSVCTYVGICMCVCVCIRIGLYMYVCVCVGVETVPLLCGILHVWSRAGGSCTCCIYAINGLLSPLMWADIGSWSLCLRLCPIFCSLPWSIYVYMCTYIFMCMYIYACVYISMHVSVYHYLLPSEFWGYRYLTVV